MTHEQRENREIAADMISQLPCRLQTLATDDRRKRILEALNGQGLFDCNGENLELSEKGYIYQIRSAPRTGGLGGIPHRTRAEWATYLGGGLGGFGL